MTSKAGHTAGQKKRRAQIINELSDLSRNGWANAKPCDYLPLERELAAITKATAGGAA